MLRWAFIIIVYRLKYFHFFFLYIYLVNYTASCRNGKIESGLELKRGKKNVKGRDEAC